MIIIFVDARNFAPPSVCSAWILVSFRLHGNTAIDDSSYCIFTPHTYFSIEPCRHAPFSARLLWYEEVMPTCPESIPESTLWWLKISMASRLSNCAAKCKRVKLSWHLSDLLKPWHPCSWNLTSETWVFLFRSSSKHLAQCLMASIAALQPYPSSTDTFWAIRYLSTACKKNKRPTGKQNHKSQYNTEPGSNLPKYWTLQSQLMLTFRPDPAQPIYGQGPEKRTVGK